MGEVALRFYAELNDLVPRPRLTRSFVGSPSVKDLIEAAGVPHTEVDLVLVDGQPVSFDHRVADGARIAVFPVFETFDIATVTKVRPRPLRSIRFVADGHLGKLARYLRLLGFDTDYSAQRDDAELVAISVGESRILLTRDRELLKHGSLTHGLLVRATDPDEQLVEIVARLDLRRAMRPFCRCMSCNGEIATAARDDVADLLPPAVRAVQDEFRRCSRCGRIYWRGSHARRLEELVERVREP